jgi:hypothetical protein
MDWLKLYWIEVGFVGLMVGTTALVWYVSTL